MTHSTIKQLTIKAILEYIEDNIEVKSIDIESIVCFSGYSRRYLQSLFKSHMGVPIGGIYNSEEFQGLRYYYD